MVKKHSSYCQFKECEHGNWCCSCGGKECGWEGLRKKVKSQTVMKKILFTILIQFGFGKNFTYEEWTRFRVIDILPLRFGIKKVIWD